MSNEKKQISLSHVLDMLENGHTREEIGEHYGLNSTELKVLFKHEKLKGKRTKKKKPKPSFDIVDDLNEEEQSVADIAEDAPSSSDEHQEESFEEETHLEEETH